MHQLEGPQSIRYKSGRTEYLVQFWDRYKVAYIEKERATFLGVEAGPVTAVWPQALEWVGPQGATSMTESEQRIVVVRVLESLRKLPGGTRYRLVWGGIDLDDDEFYRVRAQFGTPFSRLNDAEVKHFSGFHVRKSANAVEFSEDGRTARIEADLSGEPRLLANSLSGWETPHGTVRLTPEEENRVLLRMVEGLQELGYPTVRLILRDTVPGAKKGGLLGWLTGRK